MLRRGSRLSSIPFLRGAKSSSLDFIAASMSASDSRQPFETDGGMLMTPTYPRLYHRKNHRSPALQGCTQGPARGACHSSSPTGSVSGANRQTESQRHATRIKSADYVRRYHWAARTGRWKPHQGNGGRSGASIYFRGLMVGSAPRSDRPPSLGSTVHHFGADAEARRI
jgi:hypothetical protein